MSPAPAEPSATHDLRRAILMMLGSTLMFGTMAVTIRFAANDLHVFEIGFFRTLFGLFFALPLLLRHGSSLLRTRHLSLYFMRCLVGILSMMCGFWAIVNLPLAEAVSISYATPLFVTIGAVLVLGEVVRVRRWTAVLVGFVGVLLIVRPGAASFSVHTLVALAAAALSGSVAISIKFLSRTEKPDAIVLYTSLFWVPMSLVPALFVWTWPQGITWLWVILAGFFGTAGHLLWTRALKLGDASLLTPITFVQVLVVGFYGWLLFDEVIDRWTMLGAGIILASNYYIALREAKLARRAVTDPEVGGESRISG